MNNDEIFFGQIDEKSGQADNLKNIIEECLKCIGKDNILDGIAFATGILEISDEDINHPTVYKWNDMLSYYTSIEKLEKILSIVKKNKIVDSEYVEVCNSIQDLRDVLLKRF